MFMCVAAERFSAEMLKAEIYALCVTHEMKNKLSFNLTSTYFMLYVEQITTHTMLWPCGHMNLHIERDDCANECLDCEHVS